MNTDTFRHFTPFYTEGDRVILAAPEVWRQPPEWQRRQEVPFDFCPSCGQRTPFIEPDFCESCGPQPERVENVLLPDLFAEYDHNVFDNEGNVVWLGLDGLTSDIRRGKRYATFPWVIRNIFKTIDSCQLLTFWLPTRHPERVRERWPKLTGIEVAMGGHLNPAAYHRPNVRLGAWADQNWCPHHGPEMRRLCSGLFVMREDGEVLE